MASEESFAFHVPTYITTTVRQVGDDDYLYIFCEIKKISWYILNPSNYGKFFFAIFFIDPFTNPIFWCGDRMRKFFIERYDGLGSPLVVFAYFVAKLVTYSHKIFIRNGFKPFSQTPAIAHCCLLWLTICSQATIGVHVRQTLRWHAKIRGMLHFVYILECADGSLYTGSTNDLEKRLHKHNNLKSGAHYTKIRRPVALKYSETVTTFAEARAREAEIKRLSREEKLTLINGLIVSR